MRYLSRGVLELLDHDFGALLERTWAALKGIQTHANSLISRRRHSRLERMFSERWAAKRDIGSPHCLELNATGFPAYRVSERARRNNKPRHIARDIIRLNRVACIFARILSPAADLDVKFPMVFLLRRAIPGKSAEHRRRFQFGHVSHYEHICSITQTTGEADFGALPGSGCPGNPHVKSAILIGPHIRWIVIAFTAAIAGSCAGNPLVSAELNDMSVYVLGRIARNSCDGHDTCAYRGQRIHRCGRLVARVHEKCGIL